MRRYPERDGPIEGEIQATLKGLAQGTTTDLVGGILDTGAAITGAASEIDPSVQAFSPTASALSAANPFLQSLVDKYGSEALGEALYGKEDTPLLQKIRDDARLIGNVAGLGEMATAKAAKFVAGGIQDFMRFLPNVRPQAVTPDGQIIPLPNEPLPNTSVMSMSSDDFTSGLKNLQSSKSKILSLTDRDEAFEATANLQRGTPEVQMVNTQRLMGGGVLSHAIEHGGDLLHRMTERGGNFSEFARPKVKSLIRSLENEYGFGREFTENMRSNYRSKLEAAKSQGKEFYPTFEDYEDAVLKNLDNYAAYHSQLPVFNELQQAARDTAISLGKRDFDGALDNLRILDDAIEDGSFVERNRSFDPEFETKAAAPKLTGLLGGDKPQRFYHGTGETFKDFDPDAKYTFVSSEPRVANFFSQGTFEGAPNIRPVYLKDANFFDPKNSAHLESLAKSDWYKSNRRKLRKHPLDRAFLKGEGRGSLRDDYKMIEATGLDDALQEMGYDGFATYEMGAKNLAVFNVNNIVPGVAKKAKGGIVSMVDAARNTGRGPRGVASLASTARNMNRPMVS